MNKSSMSKPSSGFPQDTKAEAIVDQAKHAVSHVVSDVAGQAREQVNTQFDSRKDKAVETFGSVATAIRETGAKLKDVGPLGDVAGRAADGIDSVAHFFEGKQLMDVARDVERFARREPALFLGAAFAVGLLGGRFLKSSGHRGDGMQGSSLSDDDLEDTLPSQRFGQNRPQAAGRTTLPLGSRAAPPAAPSTATTNTPGTNGNGNGNGNMGHV